MSGTDRVLTIVERIETKLDTFMGVTDQRFKSMEQTMNNQFKGVYQQFDCIDQQFKSIDQQFKSIDQRFDSMETDIKMLEIALQSESNKLNDKIDKLDDRVHNLEMMAQEKWNITEIKDRLDVVDQEVSKHSDQIRTLNEAVGIAAS